MTLYAIFQNGGPVMWPLLLCSIAVLTVIFERAIFWMGLRRNRNRMLVDEILTLAEGVIGTASVPGLQTSRIISSGRNSCC